MIFVTSLPPVGISNKQVIADVLNYQLVSLVITLIILSEKYEVKITCLYLSKFMLYFRKYKKEYCPLLMTFQRSAGTKMY